jgi:hypothetical protein
LVESESAENVESSESSVKTRLLRARLLMRDLLSDSAPPIAGAPVVLRAVAAVPCVLVWSKVSDFVDDDVSPSTGSAIELHIANCRSCKAVVDGVRNVILLFGDSRLFALPKGFRRRTLQKIRSHIVTQRSKRNFIQAGQVIKQFAVVKPISFSGL